MKSSIGHVDNSALFWRAVEKLVCHCWSWKTFVICGYFTWTCRWLIIFHYTTLYQTKRYYFITISMQKSSEMSYLPPVQTSHNVYTEVNHSHYLYIPLLSRKLHLDSFFPRVVVLRNRFPTRYFYGHYNLNLFKFTVNHYVSYIIIARITSGSK